MDSVTYYPFSTQPTKISAGSSAQVQRFQIRSKCAVKLKKNILKNKKTPTNTHLCVVSRDSASLDCPNDVLSLLFYAEIRTNWKYYCFGCVWL